MSYCFFFFELNYTEKWANEFSWGRSETERVEQKSGITNVLFANFSGFANFALYLVFNFPKRKLFAVFKSTVLWHGLTKIQTFSMNLPCEITSDRNRKMFFFSP